MLGFTFWPPNSSIWGDGVFWILLTQYTICYCLDHSITQVSLIWNGVCNITLPLCPQYSYVKKLWTSIKKSLGIMFFFFGNTIMAQSLLYGTALIGGLSDLGGLRNLLYFPIV